MKYSRAFDLKGTASRSLLGGKGAVLSQMTQAGLPVPPGFTITTEACEAYLEKGGVPSTLWKEVKTNLSALEKKTKKVFGGAGNPLLVSVRSGAAVSMPGMMDTVLNLGLNSQTIQGLINKTKKPRFCWDAYRRFVNMFGEVVLEIPHEKFEEAIRRLKKERRVATDTELEEEDLIRLVNEYKWIVKNETGADFPEDPIKQLQAAVCAVFDSWNSTRAKAYRSINKITGLKGTAVSIQSMVFGNMGNTSGTGVAFTRNPSNGENEFYGEFLLNAQGEDVVAGIRTPQKISALEQEMPQVYKQFVAIQKKLEKHYKDMQDIEFTVEEGTLYILQSRDGKRTAQAALKIAIDMVQEKMITKEEAIMQVDPLQLNHLLHPRITDGAKYTALCKGLPASPGAAVGRVVFTPEDAVEWTERGESVILVRRETSPEDIQGMFAAKGILTSTGGMTSHAAVVCRGMGKCCIAGCSDIQIDYEKKEIVCKGTVVKEGDVISLNGTLGEVIIGAVPMQEPTMSPVFKKFMGWVDQYRKLRVRANADTPPDALVARDFGAEGIGLCRTEHMFFEEDRIPKIREMILAKDKEGRVKALAQLLPLQKKDFLGIFKVMSGYPVTIRLLDPPLHEFIPHSKEQIEEMATQMKTSPDEITKLAQNLHEVNPMLGHRGSRLAVTYPEIYEMQVRAIVEAGIEATKKGIKVIPEIELPFIGGLSELKLMRTLVERIIAEYQKKITFKIKIGTMIELPRACLVGDEIATEADFFSFGTNDLTQMTFGLSRDDAGKFLPHYMSQNIWERDPTETIDQKGVGGLMKMCVALGRKTKPKLEIGICGEHGGEPLSVKFCHTIGLDYVSCSPYRIPIAKLAAAQATLQKSV